MNGAHNQSQKKIKVNSQIELVHACASVTLDREVFGKYAHINGKEATYLGVPTELIRQISTISTAMRQKVPDSHDVQGLVRS